MSSDKNKSDTGKGSSSSERWGLRETLDDGINQVQGAISSFLPGGSSSSSQPSGGSSTGSSTSSGGGEPDKQ